MPGFALEVPHSLGKDAAKEKLQAFLAKIQEDYANQVSDLQQNWEGDVLKFSFKTYGFQITGDLTVEESTVNLNGTLPLAAMMFKGRIEQTIREQLTRLLS